MASNFWNRIACGLAAGLLSAGGARAADDGPNAESRPEQFKQGMKACYAVWREEGVWHLRATSKAEKRFTGTVRCDLDRIVGRFDGLENAKKPKNDDWVSAHADGKGFDFQFVTGGAVDSLEFKVGPKAESVSFDLLVGGDDDPEKILIGAKGRHPAKAKFTLPARAAR